MESIYRWIGKFWSEGPTLIKTTVRVFGLYKIFWLSFLVTTLLELAKQGVLLAVPYLSKVITDGLHRNDPLEHLYILGFIVGGVYAMEVPIERLLAINRNKYIDVKTKMHLAFSTVTRMLGFSLGQIGSENSGLRQSSIGKGESAIHEMVGTFAKDLLPTVIKIVGTVVAFLWICPKVGQFTLGFVLLYVVVSIVIDCRVMPKLKECRALDKVVDAEHAELLANLDLVITQAESERAVEEFRRRYSEYQQREEALWLAYYKAVSWWRDPIAKVGFLVIILLTIYLIKNGEYSVGQFVVATGWSVALFTSVGSLAPLQRKCMRNYSLAVRYFEMLDLPSEVLSVANPVKPMTLGGDIEFRSVSYTHEASDGNGGVHALREVSLLIKEGKTVGIVGGVGAGKTSLVKALLRWFDPDHGAIIVDGIDLREYNVEWLRRQIGYVPQQVRLWDTTIRRNISFGCGRELTDSELEALARLVGIDRFYDRLGTKRFDTTVGELGRHFSGGQAQLIGIARAIAKNPSLLIFDEATSNLDNESEALVQHAMQTVLRGRTGIVIAHRLSTVQNLDSIVVMERGRIVAVGTHEELLRSCKHYQDLAKHTLRA